MFSKGTKTEPKNNIGKEKFKKSKSAHFKALWQVYFRIIIINIL